MQTFIKTFLHKINLYSLTAISFLAGSLSLRLTFLGSLLQFLCTSITVSIFLIFSLRHLGSSKQFNIYLSVISILIGLILNFGDLLSSLPILVVFLIFYLVNYFDSLYVSAIAAHLADLVSTWLVLPRATEANIVVRMLIEKLGVLEGLIITKTFLIGLPLVFSCRVLETDETILFLKIVFVIGLSMAFRNIMFSVYG